MAKKTNKEVMLGNAEGFGDIDYINPDVILPGQKPGDAHPALMQHAFKYCLT